MITHLDEINEWTVCTQALNSVDWMVNCMALWKGRDKWGDIIGRDAIWQR